MTLGIWKNYDELEECLTLDELLELYREVVESEARRTNNTAVAFGAEGTEIDLGLAEDGNVDEEEPAENVFESLTNRVSEKLGRSIVAEEDDARTYRNMKMGYRKID